MNKRNIGIFAHVDAGKTTLTEQLLYLSGTVRKLGRVDQGTAVTDDLEIERERGISVRSRGAVLTWKDTRIQLIDTPGHTDFAAEAEKAMWTLDGAVLLLSGIDTLRSYTLTLESALRHAGIPYIVFINKNDMPTADPKRVINELAGHTDSLFCFPEETENVLETAGSLSDELAEKYFSDALTTEEALEFIREKSCAGEIHPVFTGSALRNIGTEALLDAMIRYLPGPCVSDPEKICGIVFGSVQDRNMGTGLLVRLFSGTLRARDTVFCDGKEAGKITRINGVGFGGEKTVLEKAVGGDVVCLFGTEPLASGSVIGDCCLLPRTIRPGELQTPLMMVKVTPEVPGDIQKLHQALIELDREDPLLGLEWDPVLRTLQIHIMGTIQTDILTDTLKNRYGLKAIFGNPEIIYKETPLRTAEGGYAYTMPKPCWAILRFRVEPLPRGSGVVFEDVVPAARMDVRYRKQVRQTLKEALRQGMMGWEVTDCKVTLIDGQDHIWHTHPLDFVLCTPIALLTAVRNCGTALLEPYMKAEFHVAPDSAGKVINDVNDMRGVVTDIVTTPDAARVTASVPAATLLDYPARFASLTNGKGILISRFDGYRECPPECGKTTPRRSVDPLDTSRYILAMRNALETS